MELAPLLLMLRKIYQNLLLLHMCKPLNPIDKTPVYSRSLDQGV